MGRGMFAPETPRGAEGHWPTEPEARAYIGLDDVVAIAGPRSCGVAPTLLVWSVHALLKPVVKAGIATVKPTVPVAAAPAAARLQHPSAAARASVRMVRW